MHRILLADDDTELCEMLTEYLTHEGFAVDVAGDGTTTLAKALGHDYDLIILDVMMPHQSGFDVLRQLRKTRATPVLMLTARAEDVDSIVGLELGADDYLTKPTNPRVLVAHMRSVLRRAHSQAVETGVPPAEILRLDDLEVHTGSRSVACAGQPLDMTSTEYSVLEVLVREAGHVVTKAELSERALGRKLSPYDRSLDMHVSNLRRKLGSTSDNGERIKTVRGVGYQYVTS